MSYPVASPSRRSTLRLILLIVLLYVLDQVSKWWIVLNFAPPYTRTDHCSVFDSALACFDIVRVHNSGVAFGLGNGTLWAPYVFLGVQLAALIFLIVLYRRGYFCTPLLKLAWAFILAGVIGNMTDRLLQGHFLPDAAAYSFWENLSRGYVVDFLDFGFPWIPSAAFADGMYHWPSFNVADSCVCIAAALFLIASFLPMPRREADSPAPASTTPAGTPAASAEKPAAAPAADSGPAAPAADAPAAEPARHPGEDRS